jgi:hypothetical protein
MKLIKSPQGVPFDDVICMATHRCHHWWCHHMMLECFSPNLASHSFSERLTFCVLVKNSGFLNLNISSHDVFHGNAMIALSYYYKSHLQKCDSTTWQFSYYLPVFIMLLFWEGFMNAAGCKPFFGAWLPVIYSSVILFMHYIWVVQSMNLEQLFFVTNFST